MPIQAERYDLKNVKQVYILRRSMTLLVTLYCLTIGLTHDRAGFTHTSLRNHEQKYYVFFSQIRTLYVPCMSTPLVWYKSAVDCMRII